MRKIVLGLCLAFCFSNANAQVIFLETFEGIPGPIAGGSGTYAFPAGWFLRNVDNRVPDPTVSYVNEAWERREDYNENVFDSAAFSTSFYSPAGAADDWMWTPLIGPLPANSVLSWNAKAYDISFPDGYEVRIMTAASGPPTGGTGVLGNQVTNSTVIFSTTAENTSWATHFIDLNAYAGQAVYIGFRNNSTDKFLLLIDDVKVEATASTYDVELLSHTIATEYSQIPANQNTIIPFSAMIRNNGLSPVTNVMLKVDVYNSIGSIVHTSNSAPLANLAPGASANFTVTAPMPTITDAYAFKYTALLAETDAAPGNNTQNEFDSLHITNSVYARDAGPDLGQIGLGAAGYIGHEFAITAAAQLLSASIYIRDMHVNAMYGVSVFRIENGVPTTPLYQTTDIVITTAFSNEWVTIPISPGSPLILAAGDTTLIAGREIDANLTIGYTERKFTPGRTWAKLH